MLFLSTLAARREPTTYSGKHFEPTTARERNNQASTFLPARHDGQAMDPRDDLVFDPITRELAASAARRDAFHLRAPRLSRRVLGSAVGYFRLTSAVRSEFDA